MRTPNDVYKAYSALSRALYERYRARLVAADPRLPMDLAFLCASNWGNDAAQAVLQRFRRVLGWLHRRGDREYAVAQHREHVQRGEVGRYGWCAWCAHCKAGR